MMNDREIRLLTILGARPQLIKAAGLSKALKDREKDNKIKFREVILNTGQHYDKNMSQLFFDQLNIPTPKYNLGIRSVMHGEMTGLMLRSIEPILTNEKPSYVLVYGDTNSTLAGALAAAKLYLPVVHIEAGLRSYNRRMPEEINRVITDHVSDILFCPSDAAVTNLRKEGITKGVYKVGDIMLDSYNLFKERAHSESNILSELDLTPKTFSLATIHRQENTDDLAKLKGIFSAFSTLADSDHRFIIPLHPRTKKVLQNVNMSALDDQLMTLIPPVGYIDMIKLLSNANVLFTDSGGMQKEAFYAGVPCITLRDETEWTETVDAGWNYLAGSDPVSIITVYQKVKSLQLRTPPDLYGSGNTGQLILSHLVTEHKKKPNQM